MSDYDRGPYTPSSEPPLAFDPRRLNPSRRGPAPVTLIVSVLLLAAVIGGGFFLYRGGARAPGAPPQPVGAPVGDVRVAAPPQAQPQDPAAGLSIYKDDAGAAAATPAFVPPPEQPTPRPTAGAPVAAAAPAPVASLAPARAASTAVAPAKLAPPAKPAPATPATRADTVEALIDTKSAAPVVQIGAFTSAALADAGWNSDAQISPGVMAGKGKKVQVVTSDGKTLYRTSITGFSTRFEAQALCDRLKSAGKTCFVR